MSAPPAPNSIAKALLPMMPFREPRMNANVADEMAQAVWDALLAEGELKWRWRHMIVDQQEAWPGDTSRDRVLVLPLAGREPEDATNE